MSDPLDDAISLMFVAHAKRGFVPADDGAPVPEIEAIISQMDSTAKLGRLPFLLLLTVLLEHVLEDDERHDAGPSSLPRAVDVAAVLSKPSVALMPLDEKMHRSVVDGVIVLLELRKSLIESTDLAPIGIVPA